MFVTMAVDRLLASLILLLICYTGFSAEISVFVKTGDSVQLDIQTQRLPDFDDLSWTNDKPEIIVKYIPESRKVRPHPSFKDRVYFNGESFSLTLKNMQENDTGLYTARTSGHSVENILTYRVSVIDAVDAPVLTVNSNGSSSDSCTVNFTCRAHDLMINSSYQNNRCSAQEVTSHDIYSLILDCSEESIACNHSNPVSWKKDRINITQLCGENERRLIHCLTFDYILITTVIVVGVIVFSGLVIYCCCKNNKGGKQSDDTDYDDVEKMTGETWTTITYRTEGHQTP